MNRCYLVDLIITREVDVLRKSTCTLVEMTVLKTIIESIVLYLRFPPSSAEGESVTTTQNGSYENCPVNRNESYENFSKYAKCQS